MGGLAPPSAAAATATRDDAPECLTQTLLGASDRDAAAALTTTLFRAVGATLRDNPSPALNVARACKIFGDIHGQFRDLLLFFVEFGCPSHRCGDVEYCEYVFNGDWVDRGHHQLECVLLLAALKVRYPRRIHLNRGNHESAEMNAGMSARGESGFDADVRAKLGEWAGDEVFKVIQAEFFRWLPVATVIESAVLVWQLLWSDPDWRGDGEEAPGVHESERALDVKVFGPDVSRAFCHMNGLKCVVRSHEYVPQGVMIQHGGYLATVFSARDYDYHDAKDTGAQNDGAIIAVTHDAGADRDVLRLKAKIIQKTGV
ncbi:phosphoprotein phosphatase [Aureococcus anophagefferens]|nr:phosphoprotein phosphatase [Aureococcus anophagefferens]